MNHFEVYRDQDGEFRWRYRAKNGKIIADSAEGYKSKDKCLHGIWLIRWAIIAWRVEDLTV
jgi:uncharacterized protein YegP (UPF0339 family)